MAVTFDFGKCASCSESNSKTLQNCRKCGKALPWAKPGQTKAAPAPQNSVAAKSEAAPQLSAPPKPKIGLGDLAYGAMAIQIFGGIVFVAGVFFYLGNRFHFYPTFHGLGWISMIIGGGLWGYGQNMD